MTILILLVYISTPLLFDIFVSSFMSLKFYLILEFLISQTQFIPFILLLSLDLRTSIFRSWPLFSNKSLMQELFEEDLDMILSKKQYNYVKFM
jgi:hypothetical protein